MYTYFREENTYIIMIIRHHRSYWIFGLIFGFIYIRTEEAEKKFFFNYYN